MSFEKEDEGIFIIKSWAKSLKPEGSLSEVDSLNYKLIKNYLEKKEERIGEEEANFFSNQKDMESELIELKKEMNDMVRIEIDRLFKEFIYNDYERRFCTNLETVIKAIVGEDRAYYQLSLFRIEKSRIRNNMKKIKLYNNLDILGTKAIEKEREESLNKSFILNDDIERNDVKIF